MDDSAFETGDGGKKKSLRVYLINPPGGDNPWRTQGDYQQEQKEARERHAMFQEQHRLLQRSFRANMIIVLATVLLALATCILVYFSYKALPQRQGNMTSPTTKVLRESESIKK